MSKHFQRSNQTASPVLSSELPAMMLTNGILVNKDFSMAGGWALQLPNTLMGGDGARIDVLGVFRSVLNALPENYDWQVRWTQSGRIKELTRIMADRAKPSGQAALAGEIVRECEQVVLGSLAGGMVAWKEATLIIVRRPLPEELSDEDPNVQPKFFKRAFKAIPSLLRKVKLIKVSTEIQLSEDTFNAMAADVKSMLDTINPMLEGAGVFPVRLTDKSWMKALYQWANRSLYEEGGAAAHYAAINGSPVSDLFPMTEFEWTPFGEGLPPGIYRMGDSYEALLTLEQPPEGFKLGIWEDVLYAGLTKMEVTTWATPHNRAKRIEKLNRKLRALKDQGDKPENRNMLADLDREIEELSSNTDRLWRQWVTFRLWGDDPEEVLKLARTLRILCDQAGKIGLVHERFNLWPFLRATCPGNTMDRDVCRALEVTTRHAVRLIPISGQPTYLRMSGNSLGALFTTVSSTSGLLNIDPHEGSLYSAPHGMISAGTGQGKSVLGASLIIELLGADGRAVMIDRGGSFNGLAAAFGVTPLLLTTQNKDITLNPLYISGGHAPDPDELGQVMSILEVMVMSAAQKTGLLDGDAKRTLKDALLRLYDQANGAREVQLGELRDVLAKEQDGRWLATQISSWCDGGDYGRMFDGMNNVPMGGRLSVIDLGQDVRGTNEALTNVLTMLIISMVSQLMSYGGVRRKYVFFDEAGQLCKNPAQAAFLDFAYRTFRKTGTGVWALTQKAMDLSTLFTHAPIKIFLRQDDLGDTRAAAEASGFPVEVVDFIGELQTRKGEFADFVVVQKTSTGTQAHLCRNYVTPIKYAMITSDKEDTHWMKEYMRTNKCGLDVAMREFSKQFPRGVAYARSNPSEQAPRGVPKAA